MQPVDSRPEGYCHAGLDFAELCEREGCAVVFVPSRYRGGARYFVPGWVVVLYEALVDVAVVKHKLDEKRFCAALRAVAADQDLQQEVLLLEALGGEAAVWDLALRLVGGGL